MKTLNLQEMERFSGGSAEAESAGCSYTLAVIAVGAGAASMFFPPAGLLGWAAISAWMGKCL